MGCWAPHQEWDHQVTMSSDVHKQANNTQDHLGITRTKQTNMNKKT